MLLIRPLLDANRERKHKTHIVVFFILMVSNTGGLLTPLGDPPLYLGYLNGVPFFFTLRLFPAWLLAQAMLLTVFVDLGRRVIAARDRARLCCATRSSAAISDRRQDQHAGWRWRSSSSRRPACRRRGASCCSRRDRHLAGRHARPGARGEHLPLRADARGGDALPRHLHHHGAGAEALRAHRAAVCRSTPRPGCSSERRCCRACSTTRPPI